MNSESWFFFYGIRTLIILVKPAGAWSPKRFVVHCGPGIESIPGLCVARFRRIWICPQPNPRFGLGG